MQILDWLLLFPLGLVAGAWLFSVQALPLFYGFPRSMYYWSKGLLTINASFKYLGVFILWFFGLLLFLLGLAVLLPSVFQILRNSTGFGIGSLIGFWGSLLRIFSRSGRQDLDADFQDFCRFYRKDVIETEIYNK